MSAFGALYRESIGDATRRRVTPILVAVCVFSVLMIDSCTACASGEVIVNGEPRTIAEVAGGTGLASMVALGLWVTVLAGLLATDHLRQTLEDGSASLCLSRPVSRRSFVWARLLGVLTLAGLGGAVLLGTNALLLSVRGGLPVGPALLAGLACALGALIVSALAMAVSLALPPLGSALLCLMAVGAIALANGLGALRPSEEGWLSLLDRFGPPLASAIASPLSAWVPGVELAGDPGELSLRLLIWCAIALATLHWSFARCEL